MENTKYQQGLSTCQGATTAQTGLAPALTSAPTTDVTSSKVLGRKREKTASDAAMQGIREAFPPLTSTKHVSRNLPPSGMQHPSSRCQRAPPARKW